MNAPSKLAAGCGVIMRGVPAAQYHADPSSVSNTMLSDMAKTPAHCYALHFDPMRPPRESTPAMRAGSLAHSVILEPSTVHERYAVKPAGIDLRTSAGKAWHDSLTVEMVTAEDMERAEAQRAAVLKVKALANLLSSGEAESSVFWMSKPTGLRCRARPDWLHWEGEKRATVLDIKTITDITSASIQRAIATYGYHRQEAHYTAGLKACGIEVSEFVFGFVSSTYPFLAVAHVLDDESKQQGQDEVAELLDLYATCQKRGEWPAFGDGYQLTGLPVWAKRSGELEVSYVD